MANPHIQTNKNQMLDIYLKDFQNNNKSIISDLFYGTHETIYTCNNCRTIKYNYGISKYLIMKPNKMNEPIFQSLINNLITV